MVTSAFHYLGQNPSLLTLPSKYIQNHWPLLTACAGNAGAPIILTWIIAVSLRNGLPLSTLVIPPPPLPCQSLQKSSWSDALKIYHIMTQHSIPSNSVPILEVITMASDHLTCLPLPYLLSNLTWGSSPPSLQTQGPSRCFLTMPGLLSRKDFVQYLCPEQISPKCPYGLFPYPQVSMCLPSLPFSDLCSDVILSARCSLTSLVRIEYHPFWHSPLAFPLGFLIY